MSRRNNNVNRKDLVRMVSRKIEQRYTQEEIACILKALWECIIDLLLEGKTLYINEKFSITSVFVKAVPGRYCPSTKKYIPHPAHYKLVISPHQKLKDKLYEMAEQQEND